MIAILKRELHSYFTSPVGYIFVAIFLAVGGFFFTNYTVQQGENASVSGYFAIMMLLFILIIPLLTMKLVSEERKMKTDQLILTAPVTLFDIVFAKYLAALVLFGGTFLVSSILYYIPLALYGTPNAAVYMGNVFAVLLMGSAFIAIGVFISSTTENQFIAAFGTIAAIIFLELVDRLNTFINSAFLRAIVAGISFSSRYANFSAGVFDYAALLYYISFTGVFLFLAIRVFEKRRYN
ncbi:MAG: ABC-2 transporter permease [Ruminococcus sp.]|nr:ABC-2 transporter permease [Candidatus Apopatosoma intestinale]